MAKVTMSVGFPNSIVDADGVTIPWALLKDVTQNELETVDDINVFVRGLIEGLRDRLNALPADQRPTRMTITPGTQTTVTNLRNALNSPYTVNFVVTGTNGMEMVTEP